jgi:hypothetical protein
MKLYDLICAIIPLLFFVGAIFIGFALIQAYNFKEKWCEKCNTWQKMSRMSGQIAGWSCSKCRWINQEKYGACPTCGWYGKFVNGTVSRRGPFRKVDRTPVTTFWGVQEEYWAYEEHIKCPKHGLFTAYLPVDAYQTSYQHRQESYYDEQYEDQYYGEDGNYDREADNRGLY